LPKETGEAPRQPDATCWICGRNSSEIGSALSGDTDDEARISRDIAATKVARDALVANSAKWREGVPDALKEFDLSFVLQNAGQFKSMQFLGALSDESRITVRDLDEISFAVRKGTPIRIGGTPADESQRPSIAEKLNEFERRTNRMLKREKDLHDVEYQRLGYIARLRGLKLAEGIDYIRETGVFYYDLQLEALERARLAAGKRRPTWRLRPVKFQDFPREVFVCTVCERLLKEFKPDADGAQASVSR